MAAYILCVSFNIFAYVHNKAESHFCLKNHPHILFSNQYFLFLLSGNIIF